MRNLAHRILLLTAASLVLGSVPPKAMACLGGYSTPSEADVTDSQFEVLATFEEIFVQLDQYDRDRNSEKINKVDAIYRFTVVDPMKASWLKRNDLIYAYVRYHPCGSPNLNRVDLGKQQYQLILKGNRDFKNDNEHLYALIDASPKE
jgi:hypothetical protein